MSNTAINIRFLFWHWQITFSNDWSFEINKWRWKKRKLFSILIPVAIYDFKPWSISK